MSTQPTTGGNDHAHHDAHEPHHEATPVSDLEEIEGLKMVMLDSAELATRSANLGVGAAENMKKATSNLEVLMKAQKKANPDFAWSGLWPDGHCSQYFCRYDG